MKVHTSEQIRKNGIPSEGFLHSDLLYVERTRELDLAAEMMHLPKLYYDQFKKSYIAASADELITLGDLAEGLLHEPIRHYVIWSREQTRKDGARRFWSEELGWTTVLWCDIHHNPLPHLYEMFDNYDPDDIVMVEIPDIHIIRTILHGVVPALPAGMPPRISEDNDAVDMFEPSRMAVRILAHPSRIQYLYGNDYARAYMNVNINNTRIPVTFGHAVNSRRD